MRITFKTSGGFIPLLREPLIVDTNEMTSNVGNELESAVRQAGFFDLPALINMAPANAADYQIYSITIDDGSRSHTVEATDPIPNENLQRLVSILQAIRTGSGF